MLEKFSKTKNIFQKIWTKSLQLILFNNISNLEILRQYFLSSAESAPYIAKMLKMTPLFQVAFIANTFKMVSSPTVIIPCILVMIMMIYYLKTTNEGKTIALSARVATITIFLKNQL